MANRHSFEAVTQAILANGDTTGFLQVHDPTRFPVGMAVTIDRAGTKTNCKVHSYGSSPASVRLVKVNATALTAFDFTGFLTGDVITAPPQIVSDQLMPDPGRLIPGQTIVVAVSGVDATATLVGGVLYRVIADVDCWLKVGSAAVVGTDMFLAARLPEVFCFGHLGSSPVLHAIAGGAGKLYVTPMIPTLDS